MTFRAESFHFFVKNVNICKPRDAERKGEILYFDVWHVNPNEPVESLLLRFLNKTRDE
jgi:hypothetical protein